MRDKCYIVGSGGHGRVVLDILRKAGDVEVVGFLDSDPTRQGCIVDRVSVVGQLDTFGEHCRHMAEGTALGFAGFEPVHAIVAIGDNRDRDDVAERLRVWGVRLANAVHPSAEVPHNVRLGRNVVIAAGVLVGVGSQIDDSAILNTGCIVDHESWIGAAAHICPGAKLAGGVKIGPGAFIGTGATIIPRIRVGRDAIVGAGAVVLHNVPDNSTVVGVPAREIKSDTP